jgi:hypothetical protein
MVLDAWDGLQSFSVGWSAFVQNGRLTDKSSSAAAKLATPPLFRAVRVVLNVGLAVLADDTFNGRYTVGGGSFRGYAIGEFEGDARWLGHLEVRSRAIPAGPLRLGGLVFYDVGHAAPTVQQLGARSDVGVGFRLLIPQLNYYVLRIDWAFALQDGACPGLVGADASSCSLTKAGWPGRFSAGFRQAF